MDSFLKNAMAWLATPAGSVVAWYLFSTLSGSFPKPMPSERWYGAFYNLIQALAANHGNIGQKGVMPPVPLPPPVQSPENQKGVTQ